MRVSNANCCEVKVPTIYSGMGGVLLRREEIRKENGRKDNPWRIRQRRRIMRTSLRRTVKE